MTVPRETEAQFVTRIIELAHYYGWLVHHCRPAFVRSGKFVTPIQGDKGFPDLVLARDGVVLMRECKARDARGRMGKLKPEQITWGAAINYPITECSDIRDAPFDVWTPDDWDTLIVPTLARRKATHEHD